MDDHIGSTVGNQTITKKHLYIDHWTYLKNKKKNMIES